MGISYYNVGYCCEIFVKTCCATEIYRYPEDKILDQEKERNNFTGTLGFVLASAASAIGLGNIWRFPFLAARDGGGLFLVCYLLLVATFGYTLLSSEIAIGRKTRQGPLTAYSRLHKRGGVIGVLACLVPVLILPYYCVIGGWVLKYMAAFMTGAGLEAAGDKYFTGFITSIGEPIFWFVVFMSAVMFVIFLGVEKGIEKYSKVMMPVFFLLIVGVSVYSLTLSHTDASGVTRTGLEGFLVYTVPNLEGITLGKFLNVLMDAMGQLFYSISVAMGIMIAYGSYAKKDVDLSKSINHIELFDTLAAFMAGVMIIPAVYTFMGKEGMSAGPSLMFISLPKVFAAMGSAGTLVGIVFFVMVTFAALTSAMSVMEAIVASFMDQFNWNRSKSTILIGTYAMIGGIIVCLGYNVAYFELPLPNGAVAQILDLMDYISNIVFMPLVAIGECLLIGWVVGPDWIIEEIEQGKYKFGRKNMYRIMVKYITPVLLFVLFLQAFGVFN